MPFKNRIFLIILVIVMLALAAVLLAPIAVSNGVRLWVWWFARQEGLVATIDGVDAPFLRPIVIRQIHLKSVRGDAVRVESSGGGIRPAAGVPARPGSPPPGRARGGPLARLAR